MQNKQTFKVLARVRLALLWSLLFFVLGFAAHMSINLYDDGIILVGAQQLLRGEHLYRDVWTLYSPGQFYVLSGLMAIFGPAPLLLKVWGITAKASIALLFYLLLRDETQPVYALAWTVPLLLLLGMFTFDGFPVLPALALLLLMLIQLRSVRTLTEYRRLFWCGVTLASSGFFRHDLAAYALVAVVLYLLVYGYCQQARGSVSAGTVRRAVSSLLLGAMLIAAPVALYLLVTSGWQSLYDSFLVAPATIYAPYRQLPWPSPLGGINASVYFPYVVAVFFVLLARGPGIAGSRPWLTLLCLCMLLLSLKGWVRTEFYHMLQALVPALLLFAVLLYQQARHKRWLASVLLLSIFALLLQPLLHASWQVVASQLQHNRQLLLTGCQPGPARMGCLDVGADYAQTVRWIEQNTSVDSCIYVGPARHDKVFVNAVAVYFLAGRAPCTAWYETHPGLQTRADIQQMMQRDLKARQPSAVILDSRWDHISEPNLSGVSSGAVALDQYLAENYVPVAQFGTVVVYQAEKN